MKKDDKFTKIFIVVFAIAVVAVGLYYYLPDLIILPNLSTAGFVPVNVEVEAMGDTGLVKFAGGCYVIIAKADKDQIQAILDGMNKVVGPRPNLQDLYRDTIKALDAKILMIKITDVKEYGYISKMIIRKDNTLLSLDAKPSDAIAIALRTDYKVPLYMNQTLLQSLGTKIC